MKNIHILPTDKPSKLFIDIDDNKLKITIPIGGEHMMNQHIYITNSEEIKEGDWFYNTISLKPEPFKACENGDGYVNCSKYSHYRIDCKKIILTTDTDLIKDGVQTIDVEFLEWFVKNPSCDEVEVKTRYVHYYKTGETFISLSKTPEFSSRNMQCIKIEPRYEIIIPKEEPKQEKLTYTESAKKEERISNCTIMKSIRETVEEAAEYYVKMQYPMGVEKEYPINDFIQGTKWMQERMYSEKEVESLLHKYMQSQIPDWHGWSTTKWFEQFKKK
jgi:hypothetical protein